MSRIPKLGTKCAFGKSQTSELPEIGKRQKNLRRSNSHVDLGAFSRREGLASSSSKMPALNYDTVPDLPIIAKRQPILRRSKSFTDIRTVPKLGITSSSARRPIGNSAATSSNILVAKSVVNINVKTKVNVNTLKVRTTKPVSAAPKTGIKRVGENCEQEVKNKVVKKAVKVPDWDYKTRFGILNEKYTTLVNDYKKAESTLLDVNQLNQKITDLEQERNGLLTKSSNLEAENIELRKSFKNSEDQRKKVLESLEAIEQERAALIKENQQLENNYQRANFEVDCLKKEFETLEDKYEKSCRNVEKLNEERISLKEQVYNGEKLRRILHNCIQDLKGNIRVFCRLRPPLTEQERFYQCSFNFPSERTLEISKARGSVLPGGTIKIPDKQEFTFDRVFDQDSRQEEIFEELSQLIQSALDGYNVCVFAYGQTGSGKTYTMQGESDPERLGMIPRSMKLIFDTKTEMEKKGWSCVIKASFLEIYNESIRDLLDIKSEKPMEIRFNEGKGTTVSNLTIVPVTTAWELTDYMLQAQKNRSTAVTNFNEHSSRSHAVTKIYIEARYMETDTVLVGSVSLVDLAGSESAKSATQERLAETKNINKSLSCLGNVMLALHKKETHIPFRNSKLTYLLQSSLGGNCKCLMVVNISPNEECYSESINALRFASKVKEVKTGTFRNKITNSASLQTPKQ